MCLAGHEHKNRMELQPPLHMSQMKTSPFCGMFNSCWMGITTRFCSYQDCKFPISCVSSVGREMQAIRACTVWKIWKVRNLHSFTMVFWSMQISKSNVDSPSVCTKKTSKKWFPHISIRVAKRMCFSGNSLPILCFILLCPDTFPPPFVIFACLCHSHERSLSTFLYRLYSMIFDVANWFAGCLSSQSRLQFLFSLFPGCPNCIVFVHLVIPKKTRSCTTCPIHLNPLAANTCHSYWRFRFVVCLCWFSCNGRCSLGCDVAWWEWATYR